MKKVLPFIVIAVFCISTFAQTQSFNLSSYGVKIEPDKRLILVLSALEVANVDTPLGKEGETIRKDLQDSLQKVNPELRQKIEIFVQQYKKRHSSATPEEVISPFISMAYSLSEYPELTQPERSDDLPDDLLEVLDFASLAKEFNKTPGVSAKIANYYGKYKKEGDRLRLSAREMVRDLTAYLRTRPQLFYVERVKVEEPKDKKDKPKYKSFDRERSFKIVPELLAAKGTINFLNIGDNYFAVVPPEIDLSSSDARRAYLQFVLDPLVLKNAKEILAQSDEIKKLLEASRKNNPNISPDPFLAVSRSLVAAVDIREEEYRKVQVATFQARRKIDSLKEDSDKREVVAKLNEFKKSLADESALRLSESYENGAVLAFYFADKLQGTEDSGFDIASSLTDWVVSLKPSGESERLEQYADARERAKTARKANNPQIELLGGPLTAKLVEIDKMIAEKKYQLAEQELKKLLNENPEKVRIHYALGQVFNLSAGELNKDQSEEIRKRLQVAIVHYTNAIRTALPITDKTSADDRAWVSLSYFALGRIYEFYDQNEYAMKIYDAALQIGNVKGGAYQEALAAKTRLTKDN